jgi:hypothetical protein
VIDAPGNVSIASGTVQKVSAACQQVSAVCQELPTNCQKVPEACQTLPEDCQKVSATRQGFRHAFNYLMIIVAESERITIYDKTVEFAAKAGVIVVGIFRFSYSSISVSIFLYN